MANIVEAKIKKNIDNFILEELNSFQVSPISLDDLISILTDNYLDNSQRIATYLTILHQPPEMNTKEFNIFKKKTIKFKIQDNYLFCQNSKNVLMR